MRAGAVVRFVGAEDQGIFFRMDQALAAYRGVYGPRASPVFFELAEQSMHGPWARGLFREMNVPVYSTHDQPPES